MGQVSQTLTAQQVSELLRISLSTVHHLSRTGQLKAEKMGKQWVYDKSQIESQLVHGHATHNVPAVEDEAAERRSFDRVQCFVQGKAMVPLFANSEWISDGMVLNVSEGGVLFEIHKSSLALKLRHDDPVRLELSLLRPGRSDVEIQGSVARIDEADTTKIGIRFDSLLVDQRQFIREFMEAA